MFGLKSVSRKFEAFRHHAGGGVAIIFAMSAVVMILVGGVALDYERFDRVQSSLQEALDSALLAAANSGDTSNSNIDSIIANFLSVNWSSKNPNIKVKYNYQVSADGVITGKAHAVMKTTLLALAGRSRMNVDVTSQVVRANTALELALVLDTTGSMNSNNRMVELKKAATDLVKDLVKVGGNNVRIAIVPYANYVNIGTVYKDQTWLDTSVTATSSSSKWYGCVGSRDYPRDMSDADVGTPIPAIMDTTCTNEVVRLTSQQGPLVSTIESMHPKGTTFIPGGLIWGWRAISDQLPFADGTPKGGKYNGEPVNKVVVLMTDGENTISPTYPKHGGKDTALSDTLTNTLCTNMKDEGITIYTVAFEITGKTAKGVLQNCASSTSKFFDAQSASELAASFNRIGKELSQLRLSR